MAYPKRYALIFAGYIFAGVAVLFTHYWQTSAFSKDAVDEQITLVAASHFGMSQLVDNLPNVFKENPHAAALKITDLRGAFLGAMYDSRRMPPQTYKNFLETKAFDMESSPFAGYKLHSWESKRRKLRIISMNLNRMLMTEYLGRMSRDMALHYVIPLYILLGIALLAGYHFVAGGKMPALSLARKAKAVLPKYREPSAAPTSAARPRPTANAWQLRPGIIAESHIRETLAHLRAISGALTVSFCARQKADANEPWSGVLELRGAILVRGGAMQLPPQNLQRDSAERWFQHSPDRSEWYFFGGDDAAPLSCFVLRFARADAAPGTDSLERISAYVRRSTRPLLVEHYYENSIIDAETGLYSNPYAIFTLKEKLLGGMIFATAALRFGDKNTDGIASPKTARTAIRVMREFFAAEAAPTIARGAEDTLLIVFAGEKTASGSARRAVTQLVTSYRSLGRQVQAALIEDSATCGSPQHVLKNLSNLLDRSARSGAIELYTAGSTARII